MRNANPKDEELLGWIKETMRDDPRLSSETVEVSVRRGVVTLRGTVQSHRRKLLAYEIAASTQGCREVLNRIKVQPPGPVAKAEIADHVRAILAAHADITKATIAVTVTQGRVSLTGTVGSYWEAELAADLALSAKGVRSIRNHLIVDFRSQMDDEALSRRIEMELARTKGLSGMTVKCAVAGGAVVLSGHVVDMDQKETAAKVACRFPLRSVRNDIVVSKPKASAKGKRA